MKNHYQNHLLFAVINQKKMIQLVLKISTVTLPEKVHIKTWNKNYPHRYKGDRI